MAIKKIFPTYFYQSKMPEKQFKKLKESLLDEVEVFSADDRLGHEWSEKNYAAGYTSYSSVYDLPERSPNFLALKKWIDKEVQDFAKSLDFDFSCGRLQMSSCWMNVMGEFCHHSFHLHPQSAISGTFYLQVPRGAGVFKIEDPRIMSFMGSPPRKAKASRDHQRYINIQPQAGHLVLFESWLKHEVPANLSKIPRISISFNYEWVAL